MAKFTVETKLQAVQDVIESNIPVRAVARSLRTTHALVTQWVRLYEQNGINGLTMRNRHYSGDFKQFVVEYMHKEGLSAALTAPHFGIPSVETVCKWERIYYEEGVQALYRDNRGRSKKMSKEKNLKTKLNKQTEEDLIAEVQRLRMENEYLKKLNALVQEREKSAKKTK